MNLIAAIPVLAVVCLLSAADAQKVPKQPKATPATRPPATPQAGARRVGPVENGPASPPNLEKLLKLTPEQRQKALSSLPPGRRAQVLAKLDTYQKVPPVQRARELDRYQRLHTLTPQKQAQVRASVKKFQDVPQPRHQIIQKEINRMKGLSDPDRRGLMNSEEFRNKFTPSEQQMIEDIELVTPRG